MIYHECCAVNCDKPSTYKLLLENIMTDEKENAPITEAYYCHEHCLHKFENLVSRFTEGLASAKARGL